MDKTYTLKSSVNYKIDHRGNDGTENCQTCLMTVQLDFDLEPNAEPIAADVQLVQDSTKESYRLVVRKKQ